MHHYAKITSAAVKRDLQPTAVPDGGVNPQAETYQREILVILLSNVFVTKYFANEGFAEEENQH